MPEGFKPERFNEVFPEQGSDLPVAPLPESREQAPASEFEPVSEKVGGGERGDANMSGESEEAAPRALADVMPPDSVGQRLAERFNCQPTWYQTQLFASGPEALNKIVQAIKEAEREVEIEMFSWANDDAGRAVLEAVRQLKQSNQDIAIQVNLDQLGCLYVGSFPESAWGRITLLAPKAKKFIAGVFRHGITPRSLWRAWRARNNVSHYDRIPAKQRRKISQLTAELFTEDELLGLNPVLRELKVILGENLQFVSNGGIDEMIHGKRIRVDEKELRGGRNIGDEYFENPEGGGWIDYTYSLEEAGVGEQAPSAEHVLALNLRNEPGPARKRDWPERKQITEAMLELINAAQTSIKIEHAYITSRRIRRALQRAAESGVNVQIIRSQPERASIEAANEESFAELGAPRWRSWFSWWKRLNKKHENIEVRLSPYQSHAKLMIVDDTYVLAGSCNMNRQSLYRHGEDATLFILDDDEEKKPESCAPISLIREFDQRWDSCKKLDV